MEKLRISDLKRNASERIAANNSGGNTRSSSRNSGLESDFDPDRSNRETRKLARKIYSENKRKQVYDSSGIHIITGQDMCDCLFPGCEGCHFPCSKCRSVKCGHECRQNRKWQYERGIQADRLFWTRTTIDDDDCEAL